MLTGAPGEVTGFAFDGGAVQAVRTAAGQRIPADVVVCCAGRWTPELARLAGGTAPVPLVPWQAPGAEAPGLVVRAGPASPDGPDRMVHAPGINLRPHTGGQVHLEALDAAVDLHTPDAELRRWAAELLGRARQVTRGLDQAAVTAIPGLRSADARRRPVHRGLAARPARRLPGRHAQRRDAGRAPGRAHRH